ncbi:MAG TPA: hypothetical protein P5531_04615 [Bacteroidales bacterium]|nr:hypothetical protein [Bacteroidales bacterium]HSA42714.1 hypothetical protein [Bacteroidales bacterium]
MKEGRWYYFEILNQVTVPGEGEHLVLMAENRSRFLLPAEPYQHYGLEKGRRINCRIDKINCNGKVFLEPEHPLYKEGHNYDFVFLRQETHFDQAGNPISAWIFIDGFGNEVITPVKPEAIAPDPGSAVTCKVHRIKKARLKLIHTWSAIPSAQDTAVTHLFRVISPGKDIHGNNGWILEGSGSIRAFIDGESYSAYNILPGMNLNCRMVKWDPHHGWIIEPLHPYYREGMLYSFKIRGIDELEIDRELCLVMVEDIFQQKIPVRMETTKARLLKTGITVRFRVDAIRKGRPVLSLP